MKNEIIEKSLRRYINSDDPLAFLIEGDWGTGKTEFIKSFLNEDLKKDKIIAYYYSLNETEEIDNLFSDLLYGLITGHNGKNTKKALNEVAKLIKKENPGKITALVPQIGGYIFSKSAGKIIKENKHKYLLVLDDFERFVERENIDVIKVLGLFTKLQEYGVKIVVIANENEINDKKGKYKKSKEKIINKSFHFGEKNYEMAKEILINNLEKNLDDKSPKKEFIKWLKSIPYEFYGKNINLRTIKSVLYTFNEVLNNIKVNSEDSDRNLILMKNSFLSIYFLTFYYRKSIGKDVSCIKKIISPLFSRNYNNVLSDLKSDEELKKIIFDPIDEIESINGESKEIKENFKLTYEIFSLVISDTFDFESYCTTIIGSLDDDDINNIKEIDEEDLKNNHGLNFKTMTKSSGEDLKDSVTIRELINYFYYGPYKNDSELVDKENGAVVYIKKPINLSLKLGLYDALNSIREKNLPFISEKEYGNIVKKICSDINNIKLNEDNFGKQYEILKRDIDLIQKNTKDEIYNTLYVKIKELFKNYSNHYIKNICDEKTINEKIFIPLDIFLQELVDNKNIVNKIVENTKIGENIIKFIKNDNYDNIFNVLIVPDKNKINFLLNLFYEKLKNKESEKFQDRVLKYNFDNFVDQFGKFIHVS